MAIIYVKSGEMGNGSAWGNAFGSLQDALAAASFGDQIWVAAGTYTPGSERTSTFELKDGVAIYGGFAGTENNLSQRNVEDNVTILSGDIVTEEEVQTNVFHIVTASGSILDPISNDTILDGFTLSGGKADGTEEDENNGGAVFLSGASPSLSNLIFRDNDAFNGGAIYSEDGSNPILTDLLFEYNNATNGAAIYSDFSNPQITNATFRLNVATSSGGAIYSTSGGSPTLVNTVFSRNSANSGSGGAIFNNLTNPNIINSSFSGNVAVTGSAISSNSGTVNLLNSIAWGNDDSSNTGSQFSGIVSVTDSIVQGGQGGGVDEDPLFVNAKGDDLRVKAGSPALDAGNTNVLPADSRDLDGDGNTTEKIPIDLSGNSRNVGDEVDLGAYEGAQVAPAPIPAASRIIFVRANAGGSNDGSSWENAFMDLQDALAAARSGDTIWVAGGTYTPGDSQDSTFSLKNHVEIYGGFAGTETSLSQRDVETNVTILSGEIGDSELITDNVYHVVTASQTTNTTVLDGFTISGGNASGSSSGNRDDGGGMFISDGSPILRNLIFENNNAIAGGGLYNQSGSSPSLNNVTFRNNTASNGGAIFNGSSNPTFVDIIFADNSASNNGGAIYNNSSNPNITS